MRFSNEELQLFKKPAGLLIKNADISTDSLAPFRAELIISVGDATTEKLLSMNIVPAVQIVDGREQRGSRNAVAKRHVTEIRCVNPAGSISGDAVRAFKKALAAEKPARIYVDGEEDLLGFVALAFAPDGSVMFYGQPMEGMVAVRINEESRSRYKEVINRIKSES